MVLQAFVIVPDVCKKWLNSLGHCTCWLRSDFLNTERLFHYNVSRNPSEMAQIVFVCCDFGVNVAQSVCIFLVSVLVLP